MLFNRTPRVFFICLAISMTFLSANAYSMTIGEFFEHRPDIPENITKWSGQTDPVWILREWVKITTERNEDYETALSILNGSPDGAAPIDPAQPDPGAPADGFTDPGGPVTGVRPPNDNGWGIHWFPTCSQSHEEVDRFVDKIIKMHVKWVLFLNQGADMSSNDHLVDRLVSSGIMPVMRLYYSTVYPADQNELEQIKNMVRHYRVKGVPYYQIFNEVNLECEWDGGKLPHNSVELFVNAFIPRAKAVIEAGGIPGIGGPAFGYIKTDGNYGNGSDYFREMIAELVSKGGKDLVSKCVVMIHNYTTDSHPSDRAQVEKFWQFETYHKILGEFGLDLPMIGGEGGCRPEDVGGNLDLVADYTMWCYEYMPSAPSYLLCFTPWLITAPPGNAWENHAWFNLDGGEKIPQLISRMINANPPIIAAGSN